MSRTPALDELKQRKAWVAWGWEERDGKKTKVPLRIDGKGRASSTDPATWATFAVAEKAYSRFGGRIGFVVSADDPYVGIDLDRCIDHEMPGPMDWAQAVVDRFQSYTEITPSGEGLRIWIKGKLPGTRRRTGNVELYDSGRYFTITGQHIGIPDTIEDRQDELDAYCAELFPATKPLTNGTVRSGIGAQLTDTAILDAARKARNGPAITALLAGDISRYTSSSEADLALISLLSFYTQDPVQLDRLFRGSGLAREKWERQDYRDATIAKALDSIGEIYEPAPKVRHATALVAPEGDPEAPTGLAAIIEPATAWAERAGEVPLTIIEGILAAGALAFMASEPKVGKTWLAVALMLSIANDRPFMGVYPVNTPGRVLYIVSEGSHGGTVARFHSLARGLGLDPAASLAQIDIVWRRGVRLDDAALVAELDQLTQEREYILIVGDVMADLHEGDENSATEMSAFLRPLKDVASHGPTVLLLTHTAKQTESTTGRRRGQRIRGSSTQHASLDSGIYLSRSEAATRTTVSFESRDDVEAAPFTFAWPLDKVDGSQVVTLDHQLSEAGLTDLQGQQSQALKMIREEPGISRRAVRDHLLGRTTNRGAAVDGLVDSGLVRAQLGVEYLRKDGVIAHHEGLFIASKTDADVLVPDAGTTGTRTPRHPSEVMVPPL